MIKPPSSSSVLCFVVGSSRGAACLPSSFLISATALLGRCFLPRVPQPSTSILSKEVAPGYNSHARLEQHEPELPKDSTSTSVPEPEMLKDQTKKIIIIKNQHKPRIHHKAFTGCTESLQKLALSFQPHATHQRVSKPPVLQ